IDIAQALRDRLAFSIGHPEDTINRRRFLIRFAPTRFAVSMPLLVRVSHIPIIRSGWQLGPQLAQHLPEGCMPKTPKPSPQANGTPESLHHTPTNEKSDRRDDRSSHPHPQTEAGDEHLGAEESQVSNTVAPAGQEFADEPKQG